MSARTFANLLAIVRPLHERVTGERISELIPLGSREISLECSVAVQAN